MTIQEFKNVAIPELEKTSPSPQLDVEVLLEHTLELSKTQILLNREMTIPQTNLSWLQEAIQFRKTGLPIAYITGHKEFYGYDFLVSPAVLIPKPDTEILVQRAIEIIIEKMDARPNSLLTICDMCTGSGCIGLSVLKNLIEEYKIPFARLPKFTLVDISESALNIAQKNAARLLPDQDGKLRFTRSNLFDMVPWQFDVILTNPPYIPATMVDELLQDGRREPRLALDGDVNAMGEHTTSNDGLDLIRRLIPQAKEHLAPLGSMLMETGEYNAQETSILGQKAGFKTSIIKDLEEQLRVVEFNLLGYN